ncbi:Hypothetical protein CM240_1238 [Clostridium bornimense]|uniref:Thioester domain-containing protein n=1 Tax=Clostridium bornimense TaxID=1216932 RepID=W6S296_9CLOT|nr:thioester domain-containing protein [Clostridium bornimense]CDM68402.1 Hypothetical protein CM240_1238 [Clostridium bornimense]
MNYFRKIFLTCAVIIILLTTITNSICLGINNDKVVISTESKKIDYVKYNNSIISSKKIRDNKNYIGYCLDIHRAYPKGEEFIEIATVKDKALKGIIANGYPNIKGQLLGLTDDEVYFATQIAIWSYQEGYNIDKITSSNKSIESLIKSIYHKGIKEENSEVANLDVFYTSESVQRIILIEDSASKGISDIKNDSIQQNG